MKQVVGFAVVVLLAAGLAPAQEMPALKVFKGNAAQRTQWRVDVLESNQTDNAAIANLKGLSLCLDAAREMGRGPQIGRVASKCQTRLLKDSTKVAEIEIVCPDRNMRSSITREADKTYLVDSNGTSGGQPYRLKARYTYEGACGNPAAPMSMQADASNCKQLKARLASMDPKARCANAGDQRAACERQMAQMRQHMTEICQ